MADTIKYKTDYLRNTKNLIKAALITVGAEVTDETPFRDYAQAILDLVMAIGTAEDLAILQGGAFIDLSLNGGQVIALSKYQEALEFAQPWIKFHMTGEMSNE